MAILLRLRGLADLSNTHKRQPKWKTKIILQMKTEKLSRNKNLNEMKASSVRDTGFKMIILKMFKELRGRTHELSKNLNKQ